MKKNIAKMITVVVAAVAIIVGSVQPVTAASDWTNKSSIYQNFYAPKGSKESRANNPTTRNKARMFEAARSWAEGAIEDYQEIPGQYWQNGAWYNREDNTDLNRARGILEFLANNCAIDTSFDQIRKVKGKYVAVSDMEWKEMRKYLRKFDPYSVLCRATKKWAANKKAALNPVEFCVLYQVLCDSLGWDEGDQKPDTLFDIEVLVGKRTQKGRPTTSYLDRSGVSKTYTPAETRLDFRIFVKTSMGSYTTANLLDMDSVLRGSTNAYDAFAETTSTQWFDPSKGTWSENYELIRFYEIEN